MPVVRDIQPSFAAGEISPSLYGRIDVAKHQVGLKTCRNFIVRAHGGVVNRPGLQYIHAVNDMSAQVRLIPFEFSTTQTYILEFGDAYMRVYKDSAVVLETPAVALHAAASSDEADPVEITTAAAHGYSTGDEVYLSGISEAPSLNGKYYNITVTDTDTFEIAAALTDVDVDGTGIGAGVGGTSERVYTLTSPYATADLARLYYTQSADVMTLAHQSFAPRELRRTAHDEWEFVEIDFEPSIDPPTGLAVTGNTGAYTYYVTSVSEVTGEESNSATVSSDLQTDEGMKITWAGAPRAAWYNVYRDGGVENARMAGFIGRSAQLREDTDPIVSTDAANPVTVTFRADPAHDFVATQRVYIEDVVDADGAAIDTLAGVYDLVASTTPTTIVMTALDTSGDSAGEEGKVTLAITSSTAASPVVVTCIAHGFSDDDTVYIDRVETQTEINGRYFTVANKTNDTFELKGEDGTEYSAGTDGIVQRVHGEFTDPTTPLVPEWAASPPNQFNPFGPDGSRRCPATVGYYEQRLVFANTVDEPQQMWMSQSAAFHNHNTSLPSVSTDGIAFRIAARRANEIRHLVSMRDLIVLTSGGEWRANGGDAAQMTPTSVTVRQQTEHGAGFPIPVVIGNTAIYYQTRGPSIRDIAYRFDDDSYTGNDLTIMSKHLVEGYTITEWAWAQSPFGVLWAVRSDGVLLSLTFQREHQVWAWARHDTDGIVESVASVQEGAEDAVYVVVQRTIDGTTRRYVERFHTRVGLTDGRDAFFVDSGLSLDVPLTITNITVATSADKNILATTAEDPVEVTVTGHSYETGDEVFIADVPEVPEINDRTFTITDTGANTFTLDFEQGGDYAVGTGGTANLVDPPVVTVAAHGLSHDDFVDIVDVVGMTEVNNHQYQAKLVLEAAKDILGVTEANPAVVNVTGHGYSTGDRVYIADIVGMTELNGRTFTITEGVDADHFELDDENSSTHTSWSSAGTTQAADPDTFELADPVTGKDIAGTDFTAYVSGGIAREAVTTVTGLDHLEGESLAVLANALVHPAVTVTDGAITLEYAASRIHAGLAFVSDFETLNLEVASQEGTMQARRQKVRDATIRLDTSRGGWSGPDEDNLSEAPWRENEAYDQPIELFTGDKRMPINQDWNKHGRVFVRQIDPLPMSINAIIVEDNIGDAL